MKVLISTSTYAEFDKSPLELLRANHINFSLNPLKKRLNEEEILCLLKNNSYVGLLAGTEPLTRRVLENAKSLRVISRVGTGLDTLDLSAAKERKIGVYSTPGVLTDSVAELTIAFIICALRRITVMDRKLRAGFWQKEAGYLLKGKILGIIGFGQIGKRVSALAKAFGAKVIFYDTTPFYAKGVKRTPMNKLLEESDIVSLHSSGKSTLITVDQIARMKKKPILINTSRGQAIDENALHKGLTSGKISFACLDVFNDEPYSGMLLELDNVILTPHIGSYAKEARGKMEYAAAMNLIKGLRKLNQ